VKSTLKSEFKWVSQIDDEIGLLISLSIDQIPSLKKNYVECVKLMEFDLTLKN